MDFRREGWPAEKNSLFLTKEGSLTHITTVLDQSMRLTDYSPSPGSRSVRKGSEEKPTRAPSSARTKHGKNSCHGNEPGRIATEPKLIRSVHDNAMSIKKNRKRTTPESSMILRFCFHRIASNFMFNDNHSMPLNISLEQALTNPVSDNVSWGSNIGNEVCHEYYLFFNGSTFAKGGRVIGSRCWRIPPMLYTNH